MSARRLRPRRLGGLLLGFLLPVLLPPLLVLLLLPLELGLGLPLDPAPEVGHYHLPVLHALPPELRHASLRVRNYAAELLLSRWLLLLLRPGRLQGCRLAGRRRRGELDPPGQGHVLLGGGRGGGGLHGQLVFQGRLGHVMGHDGGGGGRRGGRAKLGRRVHGRGDGSPRGQHLALGRARVLARCRVAVLGRRVFLPG